ncbi:MAG: GNAT family N-acetyltransferase [Planctomycetota bacterium]|jgi:ribosomal protein S18 acetylase RimI-like enzyme
MRVYPGLASENELDSIGIIRRACQDDMHTLLYICRETFPESLRWQSPRFLGRKWWDGTLRSGLSETWILLKNGEAAGFCVLTTDLKEDLQGLRSRGVSPVDKLLAVLTHPKVAFFRIVKRIRSAITVSRSNLKSVFAHTRADDNPVWLDLIGVVPRRRGQGIAKQMLRFCSSRISQLQRGVLKLRVDSDNLPARRLYERVGFVCTSQKGADCVYTYRGKPAR